MFTSKPPKEADQKYRKKEVAIVITFQDDCGEMKVSTKTFVDIPNKNEKGGYVMISTITKTNQYSDLAKVKTYEMYKGVVESICCFFECPEAFDDYYMDLQEKLQTDRVVIPEHIFLKLKEYIIENMEDMYIDPDYILSKLPLEGETAEEKRTRYKATEELKKSYLDQLSWIGREVQEIAMYR